MVVKETATPEIIIQEPRAKLAATNPHAEPRPIDPFQTIPVITRSRLATRGYRISEATPAHKDENVL